ncbi:uncharacterized protein L201_006710 [Kwoniella dendrophila CBS 6074]|uniref:Uncharacterized protein n=1 Tax=Kwoniella dendrophila CBS 6074 TaxID=1295534 RepID=A0AAX4K3L5_9TREE
MTDTLVKPLKSVRFIEELKPSSLFHSLTDEFIIEVGKYLYTKTTLPLPSFKPHFENYKHAYDTRTDPKDYIAFREVCHRTSYLLKPIKKDLEIEIKSKESLAKWMEAPEDILDNVVRLRLNFALSPKDDIPKSSQILWKAFIVLLTKLPNLIELYLTSTPFCFHGLNGQTNLFEIPEVQFDSIETFANEVKCRCCAEHLTGLVMCMDKLKYLKCTSEDSVAQINLEEPYDFYLTAGYLENLESRYIE